MNVSGTKILDIIGDFYLLGRMVRGHVHANMTGHTENVALVKQTACRDATSQRMLKHP